MTGAAQSAECRSLRAVAFRGPPCGINQSVSLRARWSRAMNARDYLKMLAGVAVLALPAAAALSTLPPAVTLPGQERTAAPIRVQPLATRKVCQLVGETDRETGLHTVNMTESRYGFWGTDLGASFEHDGRLYFLFGDTHPRPGVWRPRDADLIAHTTDRDPEGCLRLTVPRAEDGAYAPLSIPGVASGPFEVPTTGFSANGRMYVVVTTDHGLHHRVMGRSVMAVSEDDGATFRQVGTLSTDRFINVAAATIGEVEVPGLPTPPGGAVLFFGTGHYRASPPFLAVTPAGLVEDPTARRYFAGMVDGLPRWSTAEHEAVPLFDQPCMGEVSAAWDRQLGKWIMLYNCLGPMHRSQILMRTADLPWGPWSEPLIVFDPPVDGDCRFIHPWGPPAPGRPCAAVTDPFRPHIAGDAYGPYLIPSFTRPTGDGGADIYFTLSTWNPYTVVLMRATLLRDEGPEVRPVSAGAS